MILPDLNILLYAHLDAFPLHERARRWWEATLSSGQPVGLAPVVILGFVRLATSRRVLTMPMTVDAAAAAVESWRAQPAVDVLQVRVEHVDRALSLLRELGAGANLTTDAQIAAHGLIDRAVVATHDADFERFTGLEVDYPLRAGATG